MPPSLATIRYPSPYATIPITGLRRVEPIEPRNVASPNVRRRAWTVMRPMSSFLRQLLTRLGMAPDNRSDAARRPLDLDEEEGEKGLSEYAVELTDALAMWDIPPGRTRPTFDSSNSSSACCWRLEADGALHAGPLRRGHGHLDRTARRQRRATVDHIVGRPPFRGAARSVAGDSGPGGGPWVASNP